MIISVSASDHSAFCDKMGELEILTNLTYLGKYRSYKSWSNELGHSVPRDSLTETYDYLTTFSGSFYGNEYRYRTTSSVDISTIILDGTFESCLGTGILL